jgi:hypothetical protein
MKLNRFSIALMAALFAIVLVVAGFLLFRSLLAGLEDEDVPGPNETATCPTRDPPTFEEDDDLTFEEVADRFEEAATCPGYVLHSRAVGDSEAGPYSTHAENDVWIDLNNKRGRADRTSKFTSEEVLQEAEAEGQPAPELRGASVMLGDDWYSRQYHGDAQNQFDAEDASDSCHGEGRALLELVFYCELIEEGPTEEVTFSVEQQTMYRGRDAIVFVESGISRGSDETYDTTTRLYVDRETFLPLGMTSEGTLNDVVPVSSDIPYENTFVRADTLAPDFFDPASFGYIIDDFAQEIRDRHLGLPVYWLGEEFAGEGDLPTLTLDSAYVFGMPTPPDAEEPYPVLQLNYRAEDDPDAKAIVELKLYTEADWSAYRENVDEESGTRVDLPYGHAFLVRSGDREAESGIHFYASVYP